ncbi:uncharacterized protein [Eucyclogobius newberryi]|uniref:uncharacterized protein n=1 Tax=Eucyclogobius newberryi TaxID=166745 RepID=UPI003B59C3DA
MMVMMMMMCFLQKTIEIKKTFSCREKVFKVFVELPEDSDLCVNVSGTIRSGNQEIQVLHPGPVCAPSGAGDEGPWVLLCLCFVIFLFVIVGLMVAICKTRAWIFPKAPIPNALVVNAQKERLSAPPSETAVSSVQIAGPGRVPESETEELVLIPPEDLQEDDSGESTKTETISVHSSSSEEIEVSNYERRPILIDLDDNGDVVTGYFS